MEGADLAAALYQPDDGALVEAGLAVAAGARALCRVARTGLLIFGGTVVGLVGFNGLA